MNFDYSFLIALPLLLTACSAEPEPERPRGPAADALVGEDCPPLPTHSGIAQLDCIPTFPDALVEPERDDEYCAELDQRARRLVAETMTCDEDIDCGVVSTTELLGETCTPALSCYVPKASGAFLPHFVAEAKEIDDAYAAACGCPVPGCVSPDYMRSLCEGSCTLDAATPEPSELLR